MTGLASWLLAGIRLPLLLGAAALFLYALMLRGPLRSAGAHPVRHLRAARAGLSVRVRPCRRGIARAGHILRHRRLHHRHTRDALRLAFPITFPLSIAGPALLAVVIAVPVLKLEEHYFSLATLGIGLVVLLLAIQWSDVTGGTNGLAGIPPIEFAGFAVADRRSVLWFVWGVVAAGCLLAYQVTRGLLRTGLPSDAREPRSRVVAGTEHRAASFRSVRAQRRLRRRRRAR